MPYCAGFAIALVVSWWATFVGLDKDRAFYPTVLAVIASYYVLFAAMGGSGWAVVIELFIMAAFLVALVLGFKRNLWLVVVALAAQHHGRSRRESTHSFGQLVRPFVRAELDAARRARAQHDAAGEFARLERAHVLAQSDTMQHVRVHAAMLLWGMRQRRAREVFGQLIRIAGAATKTSVGLVPRGNTGGTNVSPLRRMPVPPDLQRILDTARQ